MPVPMFREGFRAARGPPTAAIPVRPPDRRFYRRAAPPFAFRPALSRRLSAQFGGNLRTLLGKGSARAPRGAGWQQGQK